MKGGPTRPIKPGDVIVLIGNGPSGTGMQETAQITTALKYLPWGKHVALITDGRFSGLSTGACVGHVGPEALAGGPIGRVRDDDIDRDQDRSRIARGVDQPRRCRVASSCSPADCARSWRRAYRTRRWRRIDALPDDTRLWAALQRASGGTWGGCVYDVDPIIAARRGAVDAAERCAMKLYRTRRGAVVEQRRRVRCALPDEWDRLIARADLATYLAQSLARFPRLTTSPTDVLAPIASQEVWAAGVTYLRSQAARIGESQAAGGGSFYDRVYEAERPELFFKAARWRVRGPDASVRMRRDATWSVPEPEVALCINPRGDIVGFTIGNDLSSRDIEGENPLYLPQAKIYDGSCALGPAVLISGRVACRHDDHAA